MTALAVRNRLVTASTPRVLALVTDSATEAMARMASAELGLGDIAVEGADLAAAAERLRSRTSPSVLIVDIDGARSAADADPLDGLNMLAEVCDPGVKVVAVGTRNDVAFYRTLLQSGVADYLVKPVTAADIVRAVREGAGLAAHAATPANDGQVSQAKPRRFIAVIGTRGGVGATTVAINLALALGAKSDKPATLLDLDLRFGTAALAFDVEPGSGLKELLTDPTRIDPLLIERASVKVADKLVLLAAEEALDAAALPTVGTVSLIEAMSRGGDWVIADVPREMILRERDCLANANTVMAVTDFSLTSLREILRLKDWLPAVAPGAEFVVIANATRPKLEGDLAPMEFARTSGVTLAASVPFDPKGIAAGARKSKPLMIGAPQSAASRVLQALADRIAPASVAKGKGSFFTLKSLLSPGRSKSSGRQSVGGTG
jgi:pilus assembly protein CpaE